MRQRTSSIVPFLSLVLLTASCADAPVQPGGGVTGRSSTTFIPVIPLADGPGPGKRPCQSGAFRQFDFWVGEWNVTSLGTQAGTNVVRSEVDGCVIGEYWVGGNGVPGWSLNAFDPETGLWHQHWVAAGGGNLFLAGGLQGPSMVISGARTLASGTTLIDRITYTPLPGGEMRQFWDASTDGGQTFPIISFDGLYAPRPHVVPAPEVQVSTCSGAPYHAADFLLGDWLIWTLEGDFVGKTAFSSELSNCLLLQTTKGRAGYEAKAFLAYGRLAALWRLTHVGSDGERLFLEGTASAGSLVLRGREVDGGVPSLVRLTYAVVNPDLVTQRWERSVNDGSSWETVALFELRRQ
jgi:hypothetical protein